MSHPIIGNPNEVNGDFFLEFHDPNLEIKNKNLYNKSFMLIHFNSQL